MIWFGLFLLASSAVGPEEQKSHLRSHNVFRCMHGLELFEWDEKVAEQAVKHSNQMATSGDFAESTNRTNMGENIYLHAVLGSSKAAAGKAAVEAFYGEIANCAAGVNCSQSTGAVEQFTQVIWKKSVKLGCAAAKSGVMTYVTCNYRPEGNTGNNARNVNITVVKGRSECEQIVDGGNSAPPLPPPADPSEEGGNLLLYMILGGVALVVLCAGCYIYNRKNTVVASVGTKSTHRSKLPRANKGVPRRATRKVDHTRKRTKNRR